MKRAILFCLERMGEAIASAAVFSKTLMPRCIVRAYSGSNSVFMHRVGTHVYTYTSSAGFMSAG